MSIFDVGTDWTDDFATSPPPVWNYLDTDNRFYFSAPNFLMGGNDAITYTGVAAIPNPLTLQYEVLVAPEAQGDIVLKWDIGAGYQDYFLDEAVGVHTVDLDTTGASTFKFYIFSDEDQAMPYTYSAVVAVSGVAEAAVDLINCECQDERIDRTLGELRRDLFIRLGFASQVDNPVPGMVELLNSFLQNAQRTLYRRFAVLRTERIFSWPMTVGTRFYGIRADDGDEICDLRLDPYKVNWVGVTDPGGSWSELICGIPPQLYTSTHSSRPERYEIRQCIEVYPPANVLGHTLRIKGHFGLQPFTLDAHQTTIDSEAVWLHALATGKRHVGHPDAGDYFEQLTDYIGSLVSGSHHTRRYVPGTQHPNPRARPVMDQFLDGNGDPE